MNPAQIEEIVRRLVENPHDESALGHAHAEGQADPRAYAQLLERVGESTEDPTYAAHWLCESALVWSSTLGDPRRAASLLMKAIERDPTGEVAPERLLELYREKGDNKAIVALLEKRARVFAPMVAADPSKAQSLSAIHEELGRLWSEPPLSQTKKAVENYRRAFEVDPGALSAVYAARELLRGLGDLKEAVGFFAPEIEATEDPERKLMLLRDEASMRQELGDAKGQTACLRAARHLAPEDSGLSYELATTIVSRILANEAVPNDERVEAADLLVAMAEQYDGEHGLAYSEAALDALAGHDRAMQLASYYAKGLARPEPIERWITYLAANPDGLMAAEGRPLLIDFYESSGRFDEAIALLLPDQDNPEVGDRLTTLYGKAGRKGDLAKHLDRQTAALPPAERVHKQLELAALLASQGDKLGALNKYQDVLAVDPEQPEALTYVEDTLRASKQYKELRDVLLNAARSGGASPESRKSRLREAANLSENQVKDLDGAIAAYRQLLSLDRGDELSRGALHRLLEKTQHWDDLASLMEQEAMAAADVETQIALERKLSDLHEQKRGDKREAGEALLRVMRHTAKDETTLTRAIDLIEQAGDPARAAVALDECLASFEGESRLPLLVRLGDLRSRSEAALAAAEAWAEAATLSKDAALWERAEQAAASMERWDIAASYLEKRADLETESLALAALRARAASHLQKAGDPESAIMRLEHAASLDPKNESYRRNLLALYEQVGRFADGAMLLTVWAEATEEPKERASRFKDAAAYRREKLSDGDGARDLLVRAVEAFEDRDVLLALVDDATIRSEAEKAIGYLKRLEAMAESNDDRLKIGLRKASLLADAVGDIDEALVTYRYCLDTLNAECREALQAVADLEQSREHFPEAAVALERDLLLATPGEEKANIARRLAEIYLEQLDDSKKAERAFEVIVAEEPEDFASVVKLRDLCEKTGNWARVAALLDVLIEVEGDDDEIAVLTVKKAEILADKQSMVPEALRLLAPLTAAGSDLARSTALTLADRHGPEALALVGGQVLAWARTTPGVEGQRLLGEAFDRFVKGNAHDRALEIGMDLLKTPRGRDETTLAALEDLAVRAKNADFVLELHDRRAAIASGPSRAKELVRQAKARVSIGISSTEAVGHGELGLNALPPSEANDLVDELVSLLDNDKAKLELLERQIARSKSPPDRLAATVRAYRYGVEAVANGAELGNKIKGLVEGVLAIAGSDDAFEALYSAARAVDERQVSTDTRRALLDVIASSTAGPRDGGRTRSANLRRAATRLRDDVNDPERAYELLAQSLVAHVDQATLDAIEEMAGPEVQRAEATLSKALEEVFDGPLVRQIVARRAAIRQDKLGDIDGAIADWKKLHDLAPADQDITNRYAALLTDANDYRSLIQLYEDQILRGKEQSLRADVARKVARLWEERLGEAREAADAWRRVLRFKPQDAEATTGLDRCKRNKIDYTAGKFPAQRVPGQRSETPIRPSDAVAKGKVSVPPRMPSVRPGARPSVPPAPPARLPVSPASAPGGMGSATQADVADDVEDDGLDAPTPPRGIPAVPAPVTKHRSEPPLIDSTNETPAIRADELPSLLAQDDEDEEVVTLAGESAEEVVKDPPKVLASLRDSYARLPAPTEEIRAFVMPVTGAPPEAVADFAQLVSGELVDDVNDVEDVVDDADLVDTSHPTPTVRK